MEGSPTSESGVFRHHVYWRAETCIPGRLDIRDMVSTPWVCRGLLQMTFCLGCRPMEDGVDDTQQE